MDTIIRDNERSWAIEMISKINDIAKCNDYIVKRAGGERTVSIARSNAMFPDVILYGNEEQNIILQGWELKMPDVPIENEDNIQNAEKKARALGLNSFMIWNFTYAVLYIRDNNDTFNIAKQWSDTSFIKTRDDVNKYRKEWEALLEDIIREINEYLFSGEFREVFIGDAISSTTLTTIIERNQSIVAEALENKAKNDTTIGAYINNWWNGIKSEYEHDESNPYSAYAKSILLNWVNRITFAHIIKHSQNSAKIIDSLDYDKEPEDANSLFEDITKKCDFFNVFSSMKYNTILPKLTWGDIIEYSSFLRENGMNNLDQSALQNILENSVNVVKRELNGQFTTPTELAKILVSITLTNLEDDFLDCCCGTGTIPKAAIEKKKIAFGSKKAIESVWASDKYSYPLQVANISMTASDTMNLANRLFKHNALTLKSGDRVNITDPTTGKVVELEIPLMGAIASNLPFVEFESLSDDDKVITNSIADTYNMEKRSDLYSYIALHVSNLLKKGGRLGIITSNSWLGTKAGFKFVEALKTEFYFEQIHISGKGRWFKNADVVTTMMILRKKNDSPCNKVTFFLWKKALEEIAENRSFEDNLINSSLLSEELDKDVVVLSAYEPSQIHELLQYNISYNAFFHKISWLQKFANAVIPIGKVFTVFRGSRRGWDKLFYPDTRSIKIESKYLKQVLKNGRKVDTFDTVPDGVAFCCSATKEELKAEGAFGALDWIAKFEKQNNEKGRPLPEVLAKPGKGIKWYEMDDSEIAEIFTIMNPDKRFFFARFENGASFINQRLIGLKRKDDNIDIELCHALLNSIFTVFSIESAGFGRGLGVLDINKTSVSNCLMFDPNKISQSARNNIVAAFAKMKKRKIQNINDELQSQDRLDFERTVFDAYGLSDEIDNVINSLVSMQKTRATAKHK